jgi:hypothetical protein
VSAIFQRPLCEMGAAYDFAYRPAIGEPELGSGGPCDDRPHRVELYAAGAARDAPDATWRAFSLCPEHEAQLRRHDPRSPGGSRFRVGASTAPETGKRP